MLLNNMYAFTDNPAPIENIVNSKVYILMNEINKNIDYDSLSLDAKNIISILFDESIHSETYMCSRYKLFGWMFDFSSYTNRYLINVLGYGWKEVRAFNEDLIYDLALDPDSIIEVIKL